MRLVLLGLALVLLAPSALAQQTQDLRLRLLSNDETAGGTLTFAIEAKTSANRAPNTSLGSATVDISYDENTLTPSGFTNPGTTGYNFTVNIIDCNGLPGKCIRFGVTSSGIGTGFGENPGYTVGDAFTELATISLTLDEESAQTAFLLVDRLTLSVGYYDSPSNSSGNSVIEDNTGAVGDDVVAFETVQDLSVRTAFFGSPANWYLVGTPGSGATVDDFLGPLWTQGFEGSDAGEQGGTNVIFWDEIAGAFVAPSSQSAGIAPGEGLFVYVYADADNDGADETSIIRSTLAVAPVNDQGAPVNDVSPDPYQPTLPFAFPVTFTANGVPGSDGWNMLSNPTDMAMNWDDPGWTRTNVSNTLYTWDPDNAGGPQYVTWTPGMGGDRPAQGSVGAFEGFWAEAMAGSPVLIMPADAYVEDAGGGSDTREAGLPPAVQLRVAGEVAGQALANDAWVVFAEGGAVERDAHDAHELAGLTDTRLHLFTAPETGETFTTDVRPPLGKDGVGIPLDVSAIAPSASASTSLTLTWPELRDLDASVPVQLVDRATRTIIDLRTEAEYTFELASTAERTAGSKAERSVLDLRGPESLAARTDRSARRVADARFTLFVGAEAQLPVANDDEADAEFALLAPAPNPARQTSRVRYSLAENGDASVAVYDMLGRTVALAASGTHTAGRHEVSLDTGALAPGLYVVRLEASGLTATQSLTVVR